MDPENEEVSLEDAIAAALDEQDGGENGGQREEAFPTAESLRGGEPGEERLYRRDGSRFTAVEQKAVEAAKEQGASQAQAEQAVKQGWRPVWYKDEFGDWDKAYPEPFRKALEDRERAFAQAYGEKSTALKAWEPLQQQIAPYEQALRAQGIEPTQFLGQLLHAHNFLTQQPQQAMMWLAQSYGVDLNQLVGQIQQSQDEIDPRTKAIMAELQAVRQELTGFKTQQQTAQQRAQADAEARSQAEFTEWVQAKDSSGALLHPYFEEVQSIMHRLALGYEHAGQQYSMDGLYTEACKLHPQVSERILTDQRKANVSRARAGQVSPRGAPAMNGRASSSPKMSLEEEIGMLLDGGSV